jgi:carboxyl-terminal processing protease
MTAESSSALRVAVVAIAGLLTFMAPSGIHAAVAPGREFFDIARSIELLGDVYEEVADNYVDTLNVSEFMYAGIDGMLEQLDPYTSFLDEEQSEELDELTTGQYAGIGVTIGVISGEIYILSVIDGYAASRSGLKVGDRILSVNGTPVSKEPLDTIRARIKGPAGSKVRLGIGRSGKPSAIYYTLPREEVRVSTVNYSGLLGPVAYVEMNSFGQHSAEELGAALRALESKAKSGKTPLKGVILDLRGNPGGLLNSAVDVAGLFVEKGSRIVSTRGRTPDSEKVYVTENIPVTTELPLAVIINGESASASEIVAGAIQELDRGIILGERSFGKGLVQSIIKLPYDHSLKLTTAKYYTPSGRLIQKPQERVAEERKVLGNGAAYDSLRAYYTRNRRKVYGGGGIKPDIPVDAARYSDYENELRNRGMFFRFALGYRSEHHEYDDSGLRQDILLRAFNAFLDREKFSVRSKPQQLLDKLKASLAVDAPGYSGSLDSIDRSLAQWTKQRFLSDSVRIADDLRQEILRHYNETSARKVALDRDPAVSKAVEILGNQNKYRDLLRP